MSFSLVFLTRFENVHLRGSVQSMELSFKWWQTSYVPAQCWYVKGKNEYVLFLDLHIFFMILLNGTISTSLPIKLFSHRNPFDDEENHVLEPARWFSHFLLRIYIYFFMTGRGHIEKKKKPIVNIELI